MPTAAPAKDLSPQFTALANSLGGLYTWGEAHKYAWVAEFALVRNGVPIRAVPARGSKGALLGVDFIVPVRRNPVAARTCLRRETTLDRFGKRLGINREFQTGDEAFDRNVYVDSDAQDTALARGLGDADVRAAIARAIDALPAKVNLHYDDPTPFVQNTCSVRINVELKHFTKTQGIEGVLAAAADLARSIDRMPALEAGPYGRGGPGATQDDAPLATRKIRSYVAALMMLAPPAFLVLAPRARSFGAEATLYGVALGLFLWCVYGITYARMFRGRSTSLSTVMVLAAFSLGTVPASATALEQVNERFDDGPLETHEAKAQLKRPSKGPSYILVRGTWLPGAPTARYPDVSLVHTTNVEVPVHVVVKPGALGVPWIVSVTRATDQDLP